ncbi:MAG TPA: hypothetical protein VMI56_10275 [Reyranella sp.]|nr:hypothetical protein [Reyranella sp.]
MTDIIQGSVLVIGDEAIVTFELQRFLDGTGYRVVGPVRSLDEAVSKLAEEKVDGAVVSIAVHDETPVAEVLARAHVPLVLLNNPYDYHSLLVGLHDVMR